MNDYGEFIFPDEAPEAQTTSKQPEAINTQLPTTGALTQPPQPASTSATPTDSHGVPIEGHVLLDAIAGTESPDYNTRYGGAKFSSYADHPRIGETITSGPNAGKVSTAAGRYQFIERTWDAQAAKLGLKDFSPESQDKAAWDLAATTYQRNTGRDLLADLHTERLEDLATALGNEWEGVAKAGSAGFAERYRKAFAKGPSTLPAPLFNDEDLLPGYQSSATPPKQYTFLDATKGALRYETTLGILADYIAAPHYKPEPFVWTPELQKEKLGEFDKVTQDYIRNTAVSPDHIDFLRNQALDRLDADKALTSQGFIGASGIMLGVGLTDLPSWVAGGFAGKAIMGARELGAMQRIAASAAIFAASDIPLEATKLALDYKYDAGDAARGIATAALFGGGFSALGEIGGAYANRFRRVATDANNTAPILRETSTAEGGQGLSAEIAAPPAHTIEPTNLDKFAKWFGGWADFSVGGKLYNSKNDAIAELAPKLTTVATQDLTNGARDVEGALDFVNRTNTAFNSRVESALEKWYRPYADERGYDAWTRVQKRGEFYERAAQLHTDPNWQGVPNVDKNVAGFVGDMRKLFADHLEMAKAYGVERAKDLQPDELYLPRYFDREAWRQKRLEHGIDGIEDVVAQAIKAGDPQLAQRVGAKIVQRAAENDPSVKKAITPIDKGLAKDLGKMHVEQDVEAANAKFGAKKSAADADKAAGLDALNAASAGKELAPVTITALKSAADAEITKWKEVEQSIREQVAGLEKMRKAATAPTIVASLEKQISALTKEAGDIAEFHGSLHTAVADAFVAAIRATGRELTPAELAQLYRYTEAAGSEHPGSYHALNKALRTGEKPSAQHLAAMDGAVTTSVVDKPTTVYRGVNVQQDRPHLRALWDKLASAKTGEIISDSAYLSTSRKESIRSQFAGNGKRISYTIELAPGQTYGDGLKGAMKHEQELILPRDTRMRVRNVSLSADGKELQVHLDALPTVVANGEPGFKSTPEANRVVKAGIKTQHATDVGKAKEELNSELAALKDKAKQHTDIMLAEVKSRAFQAALDKHLAKFEEKFTRRVARKYVDTIDRSLEGVHPDIDRTFTVKDTELVRNALREAGIPVDEDTADALADLIAPRAQRGPANLRKRTVLDENTPFVPSGGSPDAAFSIRDLAETDYENIVKRYTKTMAPNYIMSSHGFQTESAARKYVNEVVREFKGVDGYSDKNALNDSKRANYLLDLIYGKDPLREVDPKWRGAAQLLSNLSYARVGGSFGMAQTYDAAELVLRHGHEAFMRGVPAMQEIIDAVKHGGPEADALVRDLQLYAGLVTKGQEAKIVPSFRGLENELSENMFGRKLTAAIRASKGLSNAVGHASGLNTLTDVQHLAAGRIFLQTVLDVSKGLRPNMNPRLLADFGLSPENIQRFGALLQHSSLHPNGIIKDLNSELLRKIDLRTFDELMGLTRREAFRTIIEPHAGLMPMMAGSTLFGKFAFQLKSFAAVSNSVHTIGNFRLGPAYVAKSVIGGAAWATALYTMWTYARALGKGEKEREEYLDKAFAPDKMAFNVWNRVGMAGVTPELLGAGLNAGQWLGVLPQDEGHHYGQAAKASGLVSGGLSSIPVVDMIEALMDSLHTGADALQNDRSLTRGEVRRMWSLMPFQNALGVSQAINAITTDLPTTHTKH